MSGGDVLQLEWEMNAARKAFVFVMWASAFCVIAELWGIALFLWMAAAALWNYKQDKQITLLEQKDPW